MNTTETTPTPIVATNNTSLSLVSSLDRSLIRKPINIKKVGTFDKDTADKIFQTLGYKTPLNHVIKNNHDAELLEIFDELEILPLTNESVKKYMVKKQNAANSYWRNIRKLPAITFPISLWVSLVCFYESSSLSLSDKSAGLFALMACVGAVTCFISLAYVVMFSEDKTKYEWSTESINEYSREIPKWVIGMAMDIKGKFSEKCPNAYLDFYVHELVEKKKIDPFLSVQYKGNRYFIAHWEEPGFEPQRNIPA